MAPRARRHRGRHRRCKQDIWCGGARCLLAAQHLGTCVHWRPA